MSGSEALTTALPEITGALGDFSVANLLLIITSVIAACIALVLVRFAFNWAVRKISGAFKKGKL